MLSLISSLNSRRPFLFQRELRWLFSFVDATGSDHWHLALIGGVSLIGSLNSRRLSSNGNGVDLLPFIDAAKSEHWDLDPSWKVCLFYLLSLEVFPLISSFYSIQEDFLPAETALTFSFHWCPQIWALGLNLGKFACFTCSHRRSFLTLLIELEKTSFSPMETTLTFYFIDAAKMEHRDFDPSRKTRISLLALIGGIFLRPAHWTREDFSNGNDVDFSIIDPSWKVWAIYLL